MYIRSAHRGCETVDGTGISEGKVFILHIVIFRVLCLSFLFSTVLIFSSPSSLCISSTNWYNQSRHNFTLFCRDHIVWCRVLSLSTSLPAVCCVWNTVFLSEFGPDILIDCCALLSWPEMIGSAHASVKTLKRIHKMSSSIYRHYKRSHILRSHGISWEAKLNPVDHSQQSNISRSVECRPVKCEIIICWHACSSDDFVSPPQNLTRFLHGNAAGATIITSIWTHMPVILLAILFDYPKLDFEIEILITFVCAVRTYSPFRYFWLTKQQLADREMLRRGYSTDCCTVSS